MAIQAHGGFTRSNRRETSGAPGAVPLHFVKSGSDWVLSETGPAEAELIEHPAGSGALWFLELNVGRFVQSGADYAFQATGTEAARLVASGADYAFQAPPSHGYSVEHHRHPGTLDHFGVPVTSRRGVHLQLAPGTVVFSY